MWDVCGVNTAIRIEDNFVISLTLLKMLLIDKSIKATQPTANPTVPMPRCLLLVKPGEFTVLSKAI